MAQDDDKATVEATVSDDTKAKFREALERKKTNQHRTTDGTTNTGQVHGSETAGPSQRRSPRKSGSA
jgi:hypothetical protein